METMESSFYHDTQRGGVKSLKTTMTLDFTSEKTKQRKMADLMLNSPDINMLKLASPELERLIIQQGGATTTPIATPNTQILFPKSVTEEQEAYARGFVDALAELHGQSSDSNGSTTTSSQLTAPVYTMLTTVSNATNSTTFGKVQNSSISNNAIGQSNGSLCTYTTLAQLPDSALSQNSLSTLLPSSSMNNAQGIMHQNQPMVSRTSSPAMHFSNSIGQHSQLISVKDEPQRVPSVSPQLTPIDMDVQESIKLQRKRARNRLAARKCRTRKLERISRLEDRVDDLKGQNSKLVATANELREQVFALKQQILEHVNSGCKVMLSANML